MDVRPMGSRIFVRREFKQFDPQRERTTESGLVTLVGAQSEKVERGTVEAVGPGEWQRDKKAKRQVRQPVSVEPGDTVLFDRYAGIDYSDTHVFLTPAEILAVE